MGKTLTEPAATPYAEALLLCDNKQVEEDLLKIIELLDTIKPLGDYFASPKVDTKTKKDFIKKIFEKQVSSTTLNFLLLLVDRRRIKILSSIIDKYLDLRSSESNEAEYTVTSVVPLNAEQQENLKTALKSLSGADKINLSTAQDPRILGGLVLKSGSQIIDLSINGELRSISNYLGSNFEL